MRGPASFFRYGIVACAAARIARGVDARDALSLWSGGVGCASRRRGSMMERHESLSGDSEARTAARKEGLR